MKRMTAPVAALLAFAGIAACAFAVFRTVHANSRNADVRGIVGQIAQAPRVDSPAIPPGYATRGTRYWKHGGTATR